MSETDDAINARVDRFVALLSARDPAIVDELWTERGFRLVGSEKGEVFRTRAELASKFAAILANPRQLVFEWPSREITVEGDVCWVFAEGDLVYRGAGGDERKAYNATFIFQPWTGNGGGASSSARSPTEDAPAMIRYVTLGSDDLAASGRFYDAALAPLGLVRLVSREDELGYGRRAEDGGSGKSQLWILRPFDGGPASFGNGVDLAFDAPSREAVDAFHAAALATGGRDEGGPGLRPHYSPTFYTAYVRDPVGNKLNAVFDAPV